MEKPFTASLSAVWKTLPYFASGALCLPVFEGYRYRQGDAKKLLPAYGVGVLFSLVFFAVFFALFGQLGEKEHYAIMKIGQFFPPLKFIGRIDLLLVYLFTVGLFYYTALPLQLFTEGFTRCFALKSKIPTAAILSIALYFCVLYLNKYYLSIHRFFAQWMPPVFLVFSLVLPLFFGLLGTQNNGGRYALKTQKNETRGGEACETNER